MQLKSFSRAKQSATQRATVLVEHSIAEWFKDGEQGGRYQPTKAHCLTKFE